MTYKLKRYEPTIEYFSRGCDCCEPDEFPSMEESSDGEYIKLDDYLKDVVELSDEVQRLRKLVANLEDFND